MSQELRERERERERNRKIGKRKDRGKKLGIVQ